VRSIAELIEAIETFEVEEGEFAVVGTAVEEEVDADLATVTDGESAGIEGRGGSEGGFDGDLCRYRDVGQGSQIFCVQGEVWEGIWGGQIESGRVESGRVESGEWFVDGVDRGVSSRSSPLSKR